MLPALPRDGVPTAPSSPAGSRDARGTTADFALVKAVDDTSAPILKRLGFTPYGEQRCWSLAR